MLNFQQVGYQLAKLSVVDGRDRSDKSSLAVWHELLSHLPYWAVDEAVTKCLRDSSLTWYRPAHVIEYAEAAVADAERVRMLLEKRGISIPHGIEMNAEVRANYRTQIRGWNAEHRNAEIEAPE